MQGHISRGAIITLQGITGLTHKDLLPAEMLCSFARKQLPGKLLQRTTGMLTENKVKPKPKVSWGNCLEQGTGTSSQGLRTALRCTVLYKMYTEYRSQIPVQVSCTASTGMQRPSLQPLQDWACSLPTLAPLGEQDPAELVLCETEPSQKMETRSLEGRCTSHKTYMMYIFLHECPMWSSLGYRGPATGPQHKGTEHMTCLCQLLWASMAQY